MIDSSNTIKEESIYQELSSSVESDKSILVFNREDRIKQVCNVNQNYLFTVTHIKLRFFLSYNE